MIYTLSSIMTTNWTKLINSRKWLYLAYFLFLVWLLYIGRFILFAVAGSQDYMYIGHLDEHLYILKESILNIMHYCYLLYSDIIKPNSNVERLTPSFSPFDSKPSNNTGFVSPSRTDIDKRHTSKPGSNAKKVCLANFLV